MAGLAVGYWESQESLSALWKESRRFDAKTDVEQRETALRKWRRSIERIRDYDRE
jgi:glycerol kinase